MTSVTGVARDADVLLRDGVPRPPYVADLQHAPMQPRRHAQLVEQALRYPDTGLAAPSPPTRPAGISKPGVARSLLRQPARPSRCVSAQRVCQRSRKERSPVRLTGSTPGRRRCCV